MKLYGILCALVTVALFLTPAIAIRSEKRTQNNAATEVGTEQTTAAATEWQTETITTDDE